MRTLIDHQKTTLFLTGDDLPREINSLWIIFQGVVKTYTYSHGGTPITLGFWGKGDFVGSALTSLEPYAIKCLSEVRAIAVSEQNRDNIAAQLLYHAQQTQQLTYISRNTRIAQRLWLLLEWLGNKFGRTISQGNLIDVKLTHRELAEAIGTTRITVTKILNQFEREGLIIRPQTKCIVLKKQNYGRAKQN